MAKQLTIIGGVYFSYKTMIRQTINGVSFGNITDYSQFSNGATKRHQRLACVHSCQVQVDNVPLGCDDLYSLAVQQGLIWRDFIEEAKDKQVRSELDY